MGPCTRWGDRSVSMEGLGGLGVGKLLAWTRTQDTDWPTLLVLAVPVVCLVPHGWSVHRRVWVRAQGSVGPEASQGG